MQWMVLRLKESTFQFLWAINVKSAEPVGDIWTKSTHLYLYLYPSFHPLMHSIVVHISLLELGHFIRWNDDFCFLFFSCQTIGELCLDWCDQTRHDSVMKSATENFPTPSTSKLSSRIGLSEYTSCYNGHCSRCLSLMVQFSSFSLSLAVDVTAYCLWRYCSSIEVPTIFKHSRLVVVICLLLLGLENIINICWLSIYPTQIWIYCS